MSVVNAAPLLEAAGGDYQISRSVRLRSSATAYFNRTPAGASNQKTFTFSAWMKRGAISGDNTFFCARQLSTSTPYFYLSYDNSSNILSLNSNSCALYTTAVYRDPSAWYHVLYSVDTTQATASDRIKLYVNGVQVTAFGTATYPSLNADTGVNSAILHQIGAVTNGIGSRSQYFDGYLTEVNFIDGQALTPSSFGENDAVTGVWKPKKYTGTYGTNGFYLNFSDNSAATAAAIGKDSSGNGNNWTPNNISVTAGVTYDSMLDVPTPYADGGNGRGNYAVLNPLGVDTPSSTTANGNLTVSNSASNQKRATIPVMASDTNKYYWEVTVNGTATGNFPNMGMFVVGAGTNWVGYDGNSIGLYQGGGLYYNGALATTLTSFANGDIISIAYDPVTGKIWFAKNGAWMAGGVPATGTSPNYTLPTGVDRVAGGYTGSGYGTLEFNFGQRPFSYTPPSGFLTLNTQNLPDSTIKKGNQYMDATLWTGNGTSQSIVNAGAFQPDLVWVKTRSQPYNHYQTDSVRGATKTLSSNQTIAEITNVQNVSAFNSNGFSVGSDAEFNKSAETYVGWQWKKGATPGFDIVTFTAPASGNFTVNHSLGVAPKMVIIKSRDNAVAPWYVYHTSLAADNYLRLNATNATMLDSGVWGAGMTSSVIGSQVGKSTVASSATVAYLFSEVAGFSKFGSYTGNGSADGPFVYCGFRPRFILVKDSTNAATEWGIFDTTRNTYNVVDLYLMPYSSNAEAGSGTPRFDILSNGFKVRNTGSWNTSGATLIFAAFAENPFKNSLAR